MGQSFVKFLKTYCCCCCFGYEEKEKKKKKRKKKTKKKKKISDPTVTKSEENWESSKKKSLTPSEIPDEWVTREVDSEYEERNDENELEFDKHVLNKENYEMIDNTIIGKGGFGKVYKVRHKSSGEIMAAKVMVLKKQESRKERFIVFKNEIFIMRRNPYKHIIELIDHFICNQNISYIIMEFANCGSLEQRYKTMLETQEKQQIFPKGFPEEEVKTYIVQISNAINCLHKNGITHEDLKLGNVLITKIRDNEIIKVTDFGCSGVLCRRNIGIIMKNKAIGTVAYMAPEQLYVYISRNLHRPDILGFPVKTYNPFKADIWQLGVCFYMLLTGSKPFVLKGDKTDPHILLDLLKRMKNGFTIDKNVYKKLSNDCIELLKEMLEFNKYKRIDINIVMTTKWIKESKYCDT